MQTNTLIRMYLKEHVDICSQFPISETANLLDILVDTYNRGGRVFCFGNGGGASIADHFTSDLAIHPFVSEDKTSPKELRRLQVICLNNSQSTLTRLSNDMGYENVFIEQLKSYQLDNRDTVIAFSGSGNSENIIRALSYAQGFESVTVLIGGRDGGRAKVLADICILVPGTSQFPGQVGKNDNCFNIEDFQGSIGHMITGLMKEAICRN